MRKRYLAPRGYFPSHWASSVYLNQGNLALEALGCCLGSSREAFPIVTQPINLG